MLTSLTATPQVTADFTTITSVSGCGTIEVEFKDLSIGNPTSWLWDFGNGETSTLQDPVCTYNVVGAYDVSLIVYGNSSQDTVEMLDYIEVFPPIAVFEETYSCDEPLYVEFNNLSIGADSVFWDFGDGTTSSLFNPTHTFLNLGVHTITLSAINNITGCIEVFSKQIQLTEPIAQFDYFINSSGVPRSDGCLFERMYIDNQSQDCNFFTTLWGDGGIHHGVSHVYTTAGTFDITLIISDIHYCYDTMVIENMLSIHEVVADFGVTNLLGCDSVLVEFENLSTPNSLLTWEFGDGEYSTINNPQHIYYNEGTYDVALYVASSYGCRDTIKRSEYVNFQQPSANFVSSSHDICKGDQIQFTNLSDGIGIVSEWDFGDGTSSFMSHPTHEFHQNGTYDINLTITDSFGCSDHLSLSNYIEVLSPTADFDILDLNSNCPPVASSFINLSSVDAVSFDWNFGDGFFSSIENPVHLFVDSGLFSISLIVQNNFGCKDTLIKHDYIDMLGTMPLGNFFVSDTLTCTNDTVLLYPNVVNVDNFLWDFGNGIISHDSIGIVSYNNSGFFVPSLIIENNNGCQSLITSNDTIIVNEVFVDAGFDLEICEGESVQLHADGNGLLFDWNPSYGLSSFIINDPIANPITSRFYYVNHSDGVCSAIDSVYINVHNDVPNASFTAFNFCDGDVTYFEANSGLISSNNSYLWSFGEDGLLANSVLNIGENNISLIVENLNNSCKDTIESNVEIFENPKIDFILEDVCLNDTAIFIDNSSNDIVTWLYNFGDGMGSSIDQNSSYIYQDPGIYDVSLSVVSDKGCESTIDKQIIIHSLPSTNFNVVSDICLGDEVDISYISDVSVLSCNYSFGDGHFSDEQNPIHIYDSLGIFDISLEVVSLNGCKDDTVMSSIIKTHKYPIADFQTNKILASEFSPEIIFYNNSEGGMFFEWDFGNGSYSFEENPTYSFAEPQIYNVTLTTTSDVGCSSEVVKKVQIKPEFTFFVPDAFTPDGDGLNDIFLPLGKRILSFEMQVFDRWGGLIFQSSSIDLGWNGEKSNGEKLNEGIYMYNISVSDLNKKVWVYNGEFRLIRSF